METPALDNKQAGSEVVLSPEHREIVRHNGPIELGRALLIIDGALVRVEIRRISELPELIYQFRIFEEVFRLHKQLLLLVIQAAGATPLPPDCRRYVADWFRANDIGALAIVGRGDRLVVAMTKLIFRATNLLRRQPMKFSYFNSEPEAHAWIETQRRALT